MGRTYDDIDAAMAAFIGAQHVFFVATAPLAADGLVNLSPKGLDTLRVLDPHTVAYLDLTGSGIETVAHLRENGRIVMCFCAFEGAPRIVRLHGEGHPVMPSDPGFAALRARFPPHDGVRAVVRVHVRRIADSCGYAVPLMRFEGDRRQLADWTARKGADIGAYRAEKNSHSLDGLPGLVAEAASDATVDALVLVGHGAVASDTPRELVTRLKALEGARRARGEPVGVEEADLDRRIRSWPRTAATDPYRAGLELLAAELTPLLPGVRVSVAYNEFCAPTVEEAVEGLLEGGARTIVVVPSMLTPGGVHAEVEIPETLARLRAAHPETTIRYAWPFDLSRVARVLAAQARNA